MVKKGKLTYIVFLFSVYFNVPLSGYVQKQPTCKTCTEKPMIVIVPSFNNKDWYTWNLDSIVNQKYNNYKVIYIDDKSTDGTAELVEQYIKKNMLETKVALIKNEKNIGATANWYNTVNSCPDDTIIVCVDGDDALAHDTVLELLNKMYDNQKTWLTFGSYSVFPSGARGICSQRPSANIIRDRSFRQHRFITSHLKSFYAWLFKKIKKEDFMHDGTFFSTGCDLAFMLPMLEMAGNRFSYIPNVLYLYNTKTVLNDHKIHRAERNRDFALIRAKQKYSLLKKAGA